MTGAPFVYLATNWIKAKQIHLLSRVLSSSEQGGSAAEIEEAEVIYAVLDLFSETGFHHTFQRCSTGCNLTISLIFRRL